MRTSSVLASGPATACATAWPSRGMQARSPISARGTWAIAPAASDSEKTRAAEAARTTLRIWSLLSEEHSTGRLRARGGGAQDLVPVGLDEGGRPHLAVA